MEVEELLDVFLNEFASDSTMNLSQHSFIEYVSDATVRIALVEHLRKRGFIESNGMANLANRITLEGLLFKSEGGFVKERRKLKRDRAWTVSKIVANVAYALLVLAVAVWGIMQQVEAPDQPGGETNGSTTSTETGATVARL